MKVVKTISRRFMMTVLLAAALLTTFESVSGVQAADLSYWLNQQSYPFLNDEKTVTDSARKFTSLKYKSLLQAEQTETFISSKAEEGPKTLEEAVNWNQYPSVTVTATGYTAGVESTGKTPDHPSYGITYSGVKVKRDLYSTIAADTRVFPIGTILFIPGYGYGVVADTGSAIKGNKIDLYYETVEDVYEKWGKKKVEVYVVKKGKGKLSEEVLKNLNEDESMQVFRQQILKS